ncbi:type IV conjugative transfer system coupling protein TraD [Paraburkholderia tropica]|uniref:type IV conjugative transfer system coupling protein TraD n=1 Tax=Paraburkholderia tropica TaxID=92647 RepID=UPI002AB7650C|nr:type IV conjugative transfer system coupling protein TraD [Paraburkholderia tropica]
MAYPYENLFRRPVEAASSLVALGACGLLWSHPKLFLVTPQSGAIVTLGMVTLAGVRARQARQLMRFQRNLRRLPVYELRADEVPWSDTELFLGRGFYWEPHHTQRLYMARQTANRHLKARNAWYQRARAFERRHPGHRLARLTRARRWWNPVEPLPPVGGDPAIHGVEPNEIDIWSALVERVGHTLVLGTTRVGKTRLCELFVTQDIRRGDVVIVFDPKGDVELLLRMYAEARRAGREHEFYFFHLGYPDVSARYSPIGAFARITEVATRIAGQLPSEGQSAAFREFVWRFVNVMARAMTALGIKPTYEMVYQNAVNIDRLAVRYIEFWLDRDHDGWRDDLPDPKSVADAVKKTGRSAATMQTLALIRARGWSDPVADGLASVLNNDRTYFEKLVSSLYPLLEKLTTGKTAELLSPAYDDPNDPRPVFDWAQIIDRGGIVYIGLDALSDFEVAGAVGNAMFADLTSTAGRIYKYGNAYGQSAVGPKRKLSIHADEFNELVGDEFIPMVNKAGGAGYQVTAYTQTGSDIEARIGSKARAEQIEGNFNTLIMLRVKNPATAEILVKQLPEVEVLTRRAASGATDAMRPADGTHFTSNTQDQLTARVVPLVQTSDLIQLPKGQAFALIEGGQLVKLRLPLAINEGDPMMMPGLAMVVADMRRRYESYASLEDAAGLDEDGTPMWAREDGAVRAITTPAVPAADDAAVAGVTVRGRGAGF